MFNLALCRNHVLRPLKGTIHNVRQQPLVSFRILQFTDTVKRIVTRENDVYMNLQTIFGPQ